MRRREFILALGGAAVAPTILWPFAARAQQPNRIRRIGILMYGAENDPESKRRLTVFLQALRDRGWSDGENLAVEIRYAKGELDKLTNLATDLVQARVDVILTSGTEPVQAVKKVAGTIPIVMATIGDPVGIGIVASLARPGGNVTGLSLLATDLSAKRVELIKDALPRLMHLAVLWNPNNASVVLKFREIETASKSIGVQVSSLEVRQSSDLERGFEEITRAGAEALFTTEDALQINNRVQIVGLAMRYQLPVMSEFKLFTDAGAFMSYGPNVHDMWRRAASYMNKILKGAHPADLPIEQPTKFELVINLKTAKALGLSVPPSLLARADEVIE
jgi:putative ABC transport system substrate-binding protein